MEAGMMKNMVVLKNLPSNLVEEAFVILKSNERIQVEDLIKYERAKTNTESNVNQSKNNKEYIVKEAEMLINNYIKDIEMKKEESKKNNWKVKYKQAKILNVFLVILSSISLIHLFI